MLNQQVIDAVCKVARVSERTVKDAENARRLDVRPLPGTVQHMVYICLRMAEELGYGREDKAD